MPLNLVTPPAAPILSVAEAKTHLRVTSSDDDSYIEALVDAARAHVEGKTGITGRALVTQTWDLFLDDFPVNCDSVIEFPLSPLASVTHIKYYDENNDLQTIAPENYVVDTYSMRGRIQPAYGTNWPSVYPKMNAVVVRAVLGYGDAAADVPAPIRQAIKLLVGHLYENREAQLENALSEMPMGVRALLAPYTLPRF